MSEEIRRYWDERARANADSVQATTNDVYLRELEIRTLLETLQGLELPPSPSLLDVGCGDGYSTLQVAAALPDATVLGVDFAPGMLERARRLLADRPELSARVRFVQGDAAELAPAVGTLRFDVAMSDRCLINLASAQRQRLAIEGIAACLKPGGRYLAIENFMEGQDALNAARSAVGLSEIPVRWHNLFFTEPLFRSCAEPLFEDLRFVEFASSYYLATRVLYSKRCSEEGVAPDYLHWTHRLAGQLPQTGCFSPIRLVTMIKTS